MFWSFDSCILIEDISDHLPAITLLKHTKILDRKPIEFNSRGLTDDKLRIIKHKLHRVDWIGELNSNDVNTNFDHFVPITNEKMDEVAPEKLVRISGKRRFVEPWMTIGIEESVKKKCKELYKNTLQKDVSPETIQIYKDYRNTFNKLKRNTKKNYYNERCLALKNNTKEINQQNNWKEEKYWKHYTLYYN